MSRFLDRFRFAPAPAERPGAGTHRRGTVHAALHRSTIRDVLEAIDVRTGWRGGAPIGTVAAGAVPILLTALLIFTLSAASSLLIEAFGPLTLVNRRMSQFWAISAFGMHWGIYLIMRITFRYQMTGMIFLSFFPMELLVPPLLRGRAHSQTPRPHREAAV